MTAHRLYEADLVASEIEGARLVGKCAHLRAIAIDERGFPLKIVAVDPPVWAIHKHWIAQRLDRDPLKKQRDAEQAIVVGAIAARRLVHLPFAPNELRMLPLDLVEQARPLFSA
jgi:hypothetical protein